MGNCFPSQTYESCIFIVVVLMYILYNVMYCCMYVCCMLYVCMYVCLFVCLFVCCILYTVISYRYIVELYTIDDIILLSVILTRGFNMI